MSSIVLKGSKVSVTFIRINSCDMAQVARDLMARVKLAPSFFQGAPVVLQPPDNLEFMPDHLLDLLVLMRKSGMSPIGVNTKRKDLLTCAQQQGLAAISRGTSPAAKQDIHSVSILSAKPKIIAKPIRSGQQIYAKGSDLIVMGSVHAGSEIMADGDIHIYGKLHGKAVAGAKGNLKARIFAHEFQPEMVAIAGYYKVSESIPKKLSEKPVHVSLDGKKVSISPM